MAIRKSRKGRRLRARKANGVAPAASPEERTAPSTEPKTGPATPSATRPVRPASSADHDLDRLASEGPGKVVWVIVALSLTFIIIITWLISLG